LNKTNTQMQNYQIMKYLHQIFYQFIVKNYWILTII
jgi:hypothetical protein